MTRRELDAGTLPRSEPELATLGALGHARIRSLCAAVGVASEASRACELFDLMGSTWLERPIGRGPHWPSDITDDHTPFEFSVAFENGQAHLRMLTEAQGDLPSLTTNWDAAWELTERLGATPTASIERALLVKDLFEPHHPANRFALWHATDLRPGRDPRFKLYLSPWSRSPDDAHDVVCEALTRLNLSAAWYFLRESVLLRGERDRFIYFALDLDDTEHARVKVYVLHEGVRADELDKVVAAARATPKSEDATWFCNAMTGSEGPFRDRPVLSCLAFVAERGGSPLTHTLHVPVRCYADHDRTVLDRVSSIMSPEDAAVYQQAVGAVANRPLEARCGIQTYASFRREGNAQRLTIYLATEAYQTMMTNTQKAVVRGPATPEDFLAYSERHSVADHPLFQTLRKRPPSASSIWLLVANLDQGVALHFTRWLAQIVAACPELSVRSILAHQLDDELGNGDPSKVHRLMFERFLGSLAPNALPGDSRVLLAPGNGFREACEALFDGREPWQAVGALMVIEILARQFDAALADEIRRCGSFIDQDAAGWAFLHEQLEKEHAQDSHELADYIPNAPFVREELARGAHRVREAGMKFVDGMHRVLVQP
jgi:DMATS type aromatic prenyltransferase